MTLIDSLDSILMLYSYTGFPEQKFALFVRRQNFRLLGSPGETSPTERELDIDEDRPEKINMRVKMNAMSGLSIILTLMSILVAFRCAFSSDVTDSSLPDLQHRLDYNHGSHRRRVRTLQGSGARRRQSFSGGKVVERLGTGK